MTARNWLPARGRIGQRLGKQAKLDGAGNAQFAFEAFAVRYLRHQGPHIVVQLFVHEQERFGELSDFVSAAGAAGMPPTAEPGSAR